MSDQGVFMVWTGARDLYYDDYIIFVKTGQSFNPGSWNHGEGDCVNFLDGQFGLEACDATMNFVCEVESNSV